MSRRWGKLPFLGSEDEFFYHTAMSLPVSSTISSVDLIEVLEQNLAIVRGFQTMRQQEMQALREQCKLPRTGAMNCTR
jgi:hypothetical protein